jgi:hypothetical protein
MVGVIILVCLLTGPRAKWVKRFLPNTANRIVFIVIVALGIIASTLQGASSLSHGDRGEGYFTLVFNALCVAALLRFIYDWWLKVRQPPNVGEDA